VTVGIPAYAALVAFDRPAADLTVTGSVAVSTVIAVGSNAGARIWILVPVMLTMLSSCCEDASVASPKLTQSRLA